MAEQQIFDRDGVAVITGGGSGFGLEAASRCAKMGMAVAIADVQEDALQTAVKTLANLSPGGETMVLGHKTDVSSEQSVFGFGQAVAAKWPAKKISFVFNNAGVLGNFGASALQSTPKDWQFVLGVNVIGVANILKTFVPGIIEAGPLASGKPCHVVQTSSIAGLLPMTSDPYHSSKMAVTQITEGLHLELQQDPKAKHVSLHCLHPNGAQTSIWFSQRNRPTELEHEGTAATKARDDKVGVKMNAMLAKTGGLTAGDVVSQLFDGIANNDFYIKACTEAQGGQAAINGAIQQRLEDQTSGRLPTPFQGFSQPPRPAKL